MELMSKDRQKYGDKQRNRDTKRNAYKKRDQYIIFDIITI